MKKWIVTALLLCGIMWMTACSKQEEVTGKAIQIYYIDNSESAVTTREHILKSTVLEEQVVEVMAALSTMPEKLEYKAPLAMGFEVLDYMVDSGSFALNVNSEYQKMSPTTEVLVRACLVSTLTQLEGVDTMSITIEGNSLYDSLGKLVGAMTAEQFINNPGNEIGNYDTVILTLYFTNENGDGLIAVNREKGYNTNISLDKLVVEELIAGPSASVGGLYPTVNPDTKAISVLTKDGICYVNLSAEFLDQVTNVSADATIYSIVNSLTELNTVEKVQIAIDGDTTGTYREKYSFSTVYEREMDLVTTLEAAESTIESEESTEEKKEEKK